MPDAADDALLDRARSGEVAAIEALLERWQPRILRYGLRMCRDREDAEDVLQETMLAAARGVGGFEGASAASTWLYAIARSFCIKQRRRRRFAAREVSIDGEGGRTAGMLADTSPDPEKILAGRRLASALEGAIAALPLRDREVLVLRDIDGQRAADVARVTGLSVAAVKSRLHRARAAVRERLIAAGGPADPAAREPACPDVIGLLSRKLEGEIDPAACAEMEAHVVSCTACRAACESLRELLAECRRSPLPDVPAALQESIRTRIRAVLAARP